MTTAAQSRYDRAGIERRRIQARIGVASCPAQPPWRRGPGAWAAPLPLATCQGPPIEWPFRSRVNLAAAGCAARHMQPGRTLAVMGCRRPAAVQAVRCTMAGKGVSGRSRHREAASGKTAPDGRGCCAPRKPNEPQGAPPSEPGESKSRGRAPPGRSTSCPSRPSTNQIACTGVSPTLASRCGVVDSSETASPGSST